MADPTETNAAPSPVELTEATFESVVTKGIVLVDWWAPWCGPCLRFAPVFEAAAAKHPDVTFAKVNTDVEQQLAGGFRIRSIPTLMVFRDGILLFNEAGMLPPAALEDLVKQVSALDMDEVRKKVEEQHAHGHEHGPGCNHDH
jgi:thioredoxin 1